MESKIFRTFLITIALVAIVGCKNNDIIATHEKEYQTWIKDNPDCQDGSCYMICGNINTNMYDGHKVYLSTISNGVNPYNGDYYSKENIIDSAIVENREFIFMGNVARPQIAVVRTEAVGNDERSVYERNVCETDLILEPGAITVSITRSRWDTSNFVGGTQYNNKLQLFLKESSKLRHEFYVQHKSTITRVFEIESQLDAGVIEFDDLDSIEVEKIDEELGQADEELETKNRALLWDLYNDNNQNFLSLYALNKLYELDERFVDEKFVDSLMHTASGDIKSSLEIRLSSFEIKENLDVNIKKNQKVTSKGNKYINVNGLIKTKEGDTWKVKQGSLKDLIDGKVAVVDFWASWCGPCREEIKESLLGLHEKYKNRDVVVVGIDVSDKIEYHAEAIKQLGVTYPQLIDTSGFSDYTYGVESIPTILVIAPDGTILDRGLRGKEIEKAVVKALKMRGN